MEHFNSKELKDALDMLEREKKIDRDAMIDAIRVALEAACKDYFNKNNKDHVPIDLNVVVDKDSCNYAIFLGKEVIDDNDKILSDLTEVKYSEAIKYDQNCNISDIVYIPIPEINFGHILTQKAKSIIIQKLREQEKNSLYLEFKSKEHTVLEGNVRKQLKEGLSINLGAIDGILLNNLKVKEEKYNLDDRIYVYVEEVIEQSKGPKVILSRVSPYLVVKLLEKESEELRDGVVEVVGIAREAGIRTKLSVKTSDKTIDAVGSLLGVNSIRINSVVEKLNGEKIDVINYDEDISKYIENAISPSKTSAIVVDEETKSALVIVPDYQLSLAIGKEGQNARLAAKLTNYKIDIKSETQAIDSGIADQIGLSYDKEKYLQEKAEEEAKKESNEEINNEYQEDEDISNQTINEEVED